MTRSLDLLTAAGWLSSMGDIATAKATQIALAERGVPVVPVDEHRTGRTTIIGGGHVLGFQPSLRHFIVPGPHILNAAGVTPTGDYGYLRDYRYVSVRDAESSKLIGVPCEQVPCPAMLLEPSQLVRDFFPARRSIVVVVHRDPLCERVVAKRESRDYLVVDPQPHRQRTWTSGGIELPTTHCPEMLIASMRGAHVVLSHSLHLGIFALVAGVPFAIIDTGDAQSLKCRSYFARAGIPNVMTTADDPIGHAVGLSYDWAAVRDRERARCNQHFDAIVASISG